MPSVSRDGGRPISLVSFLDPQCSRQGLNVQHSGPRPKSRAGPRAGSNRPEVAYFQGQRRCALRCPVEEVRDRQIEDLNMSASRGLDRRVIPHLAQGERIRQHVNILVLGPTGVGKRFLSRALADSACRYGRSSPWLPLKWASLTGMAASRSRPSAMLSSIIWFRRPVGSSCSGNHVSRSIARYPMPTT